MADRTVTIRLDIDDSGAIRKATLLGNKLKTAEKNASRLGKEGSKSFRLMNQGAGRVVLKLAAMLLSLAAIRRAFNVMARAAKTFFTTAIGALVLFEQASIGMQAALASQLTVSKDATQNFMAMGGMAEAIIFRLIELDRQTIATFDELLTGVNVFIATGGLKLVKTMEGALQATTLLVNASRIFSRQSNQQLALLTNIRAVLQGTSFQMAEVLQIITTSGATWKENLKTLEKNKGLLAELRKELSGVATASDKLAETSVGIQTTVQTLRDLFLRQAFTSTFESAKDAALDLFVAIERNRGSIDLFLQRAAALSLALFELFREVLQSVFALLSFFVRKFIPIEDIIFAVIKEIKEARALISDPLLPFKVIVPGKARDRLAAINFEVELLRQRINNLASAVGAPNFADILNRSLESMLNTTLDTSDALKELSKGLKLVRLPGPTPRPMRRPGELGISRRFAGPTLPEQRDIRNINVLPEGGPIPAGVFENFEPGAAIMDELTASLQATAEAFELVRLRGLTFRLGMAETGDTLIEFSDKVNNLVVGTFQAFGQLISDALAGTDEPLRKFIAGILGMFGDFAIQLGSAMILLGLGLEALFSLNPGALIAVGAALVLIGGLLKGFSSRLAGTATSGGGSTFQQDVARPIGPQEIDLASINPQQGIPQESNTGPTEIVLSRVADTLDRLDTVPPGVVVMDGVKESGGVARLMTASDNAVVARRTLNTNAL